MTNTNPTALQIANARDIYANRETRVLRQLRADAYDLGMPKWSVDLLTEEIVKRSREAQTIRTMSDWSRE